MESGLVGPAWEASGNHVLIHFRQQLGQCNSLRLKVRTFNKIVSDSRRLDETSSASSMRNVFSGDAITVVDGINQIQM